MRTQTEIDRLQKICLRRAKELREQADMCKQAGSHALQSTVIAAANQAQAAADAIAYCKGGHIAETATLCQVFTWQDLTELREAEIAVELGCSESEAHDA